MTTKRREPAFWALQVPRWVLLAYLVYTQGITAISYNLGVAMGTQESAETITEVGTAFWYGFALGDLVIYIPILLVGLVGHVRGTQWGRDGLAAALGIHGVLADRVPRGNGQCEGCRRMEGRQRGSLLG